MDERSYKRRLEKWSEKITGDYPPAIVGHLCVGIAASALGDGSINSLIRHLIEHQRSIVRMCDPDTDEYKELQAMVKDVDDLELEAAAQGIAHLI